MTATKDELLEHLGFLRDTACIACHPDSGECDICEDETIEIKQILTQHFSVTDSERKEAMEWAHDYITHEMRGDEPCEDTVGVCKVILKTLGGLNEK